MSWQEGALAQISGSLPVSRMDTQTSILLYILSPLTEVKGNQKANLSPFERETLNGLFRANEGLF